jgi:hypothetical protein
LWKFHRHARLSIGSHNNSSLIKPN